MNFLPKRYLTNFIKFYELITVIIFILDQVSSSVPIGNNKGTIYLDNNTNYDHILSDVRRNKRQNNNDGVNCQMPANQLHTKYVILGDSVTNYMAGDYVKQYSVLQMSCHTGYALSQFTQNPLYCINGAWSQPPSACIRTCSSLISTETTAVTCSLNNKPLDNCINPVRGTIALLSCKPLYEDPNIQRNPVRVCREGRWDPSISSCYPTCGNKHPRGNTNIIGGNTVTVGDYPWQIGIYNSTTKSFLCGGSIIEQNIILTAAHCLTDYYGKVKSAAHYVVAAGKYFSRYDEPRDGFAQYSSVLTIHVPERYTGLTNAYAQDIAIMILSNPFTLSEAVQPVCVELIEDHGHLSFLPDSNNGIVAGWGLTTEGGEISTELKEIIIPQIPFSQCSVEVPNSFKRYITADKICGGYLNSGASICMGDSGGALVLKNRINERYYAKGIVSTSPATDSLTCDSNQYSVFTSVDKHKEFVRDVVALNQFRSQLECIASDCTTEEDQTEKAKTQKEVPTFRVVCYFASWSVYRPGTAKFSPEDITPSLCTHIIYAFGQITDDITLKPVDEYADITLGGYAKFTGRKDQNKDLKALLCVGGWSQGTTKFVSIAADAEKRQKLVNNSIAFLRQHNFDGLDLAWQFPYLKDRKDYSSLIQELHEGYERESRETGKPRLLLSITLQTITDHLNSGYDIPKITRYLDWMSALTYDYHTQDEPTVNHHSQLYSVNGILDRQLNANFTINYVAQSGAPKEKLVLGIPTYGRSLNLSDPSMTVFGSKAVGPGLKGEQTNENGFLAYFEICQKIKYDGWTVERPYPNAMGPYAHKDNQWVSYDDENIVKKKTEYAVANKLGGIMFWVMEHDDFRGNCTGKQFPLIEAAKEVLKNA